MKIDGVFSGGGIRGLALIGAYEELEARGITFSRLAGTSAGSLLAALIASGYTSKELKQELLDLDASQFLDQPSPLFSIKFLNWLPIYWRMGLYKGAALEAWIDRMLSAKGVKTFGDLAPGALKIVASDVSNGRIMILPDDLHKYDIPFESFPVAKAVRMSCSIPYFFEPVKIKSGKNKIVVVDGGVLSNFPIWLYDDLRKKNIRPVLGIKLSHQLNDIPPKQVNNALKLFEALFTTMMDAHDSRYISKRHVNNIIFIPTEGIASTEFGIEDTQKEALIAVGRDRTRQFLKKWMY